MTFIPDWFISFLGKSPKKMHYELKRELLLYFMWSVGYKRSIFLVILVFVFVKLLSVTSEVIVFFVLSLALPLSILFIFSLCSTDFDLIAFNPVVFVYFCAAVACLIPFSFPLLIPFLFFYPFRLCLGI